MQSPSEKAHSATFAVASVARGVPSHGPTIAYELCSGILVVARSEQPTSALEFEEFLAFQSTVRLRAILASEDGAPFSANQRKAIAHYWQAVAKREPAVASLSDSLGIRMALTAFRWLGFTKLHVFPAAAHDRALECLGVPREERPAVAAVLLRLRRSVRASPHEGVAAV